MRVFTLIHHDNSTRDVQQQRLSTEDTLTKLTDKDKLDIIISCAKQFEHSPRLYLLMMKATREAYVNAFGEDPFK